MVDENNEGGYMISKDDLPELMKEAEMGAQRVLGLLAFRLLCESKKKENNHG